MRRYSTLILAAALLTGCRGANNNFALFSPNSTRVPPPGTKSYGVPDGNYYVRPPQTSSTSGDGGVSAVATNSGNSGTGTSTDSGNPATLSWQPPRAKSGLRRSASNTTDSSGKTVMQASYDVPERESAKSSGVTESPVRVAEGSNNGSSMPRIKSMAINDATQLPRLTTDSQTSSAIEISKLPAPAMSGASPLGVRPPATTVSGSSSLSTDASAPTGSGLQ